MQSSINSRLLSRELDANRPRTSPKGLYGHHQWVQDLDIVDELTGHTGCVNALSWSKSGQFLASGSDDTHLNIHRYQPHEAIPNFALQTSIATGHSANIFSVKFMPYSGDRTLVSAAGDADIRIFDLEYAARNLSGSITDEPPSRTAGKRASGRAAQILSEDDANTKIYRSHTERVKRIVTESSPFLFLSCSEDGEVRQWDIRQPSSAYPRPRAGRGFRGVDGDESNVPPPLISYRKYNLDLHTISCSPSQPHYIALGGVHLHCFLHDRRMLGRDRTEERGSRHVKVKTGQNGRYDDSLDEATRCVRRFAPLGQQEMKRNDNGHITACKISDARPNEMVVSWSGDHIYSFDLMRSPDARESIDDKTKRRQTQRGGTKKRKRAMVDRHGNNDVHAAESSRESKQQKPKKTSLKVNYENGQTERIPLISDDEVDHRSEATRIMSLTPQEKLSDRLAKAVVTISSEFFTSSEGDMNSREMQARWSSVLTSAASILPDIDEASRTWTYPVNPDAFELNFQTTLRKYRQKVRRFVQACGTLARLLGGTINADYEAALSTFNQIEPAPRELPIEDQSEQFSYDFLKSIALWLGSGTGAIVQGFSTSALQPKNPRFPVIENSGIEAVEEVIVPYLQQLAGSRTIRNLEVSRFEVDENRTLVDSEQTALAAFASALETQFTDLTSDQISEGNNSNDVQCHGLSREAAREYWAFKVGRSVLLNAGSDVNYALVDRAFGGLGRTPRKEKALEQSLEDNIYGVPISDDELAMESLAMEPGSKARIARKERLETATSENSSSKLQTAPSSEDNHDEEDPDDDMISINDVRSAMNNAAEANPYNSDNFESSGADSSSNDNSEEEDEEGDEYEDEFTNAYIFRSALARSAQRCRVHHEVPCFGSFRSYSGAANARTVKDVNFWGLNDEYVVAGSDDGNFFIWDRDTTQRLNILEGDGEVVNVIQGHPYEPILAVSGIDHTIKVFSPDKVAQKRARMGLGVSNIDSSGFSSLHIGGRMHRGARSSRQTLLSDEIADRVSFPQSKNSTLRSKEDNEESSDDQCASPLGLASRRRMHDEYAITSQNEIERRDGPREAFITRSMLAQILGHARARTRATNSNNNDDAEGEENGDDEDGIPLTIENGRIVIGDDCTLM